MAGTGFAPLPIATQARIVALLPMKANSERVKGKNFREFCGKPLFRWILDALLAIDEIDEVVINTDARHILAENGLVEGGRVRIRDRKPELCGDTVSMNLILADDIAAVPADTVLALQHLGRFGDAQGAEFGDLRQQHCVVLVHVLILGIEAVPERGQKTKATLIP